MSFAPAAGTLNVNVKQEISSPAQPCSFDEALQGKSEPVPTPDHACHPLGWLLILCVLIRCSECRWLQPGQSKPSSQCLDNSTQAEQY